MFTCFTPGTTPEHNDMDPLHNELAFCVDGDDASVLKLLYWYTNKTIVTRVNLGFNANEGLHTHMASSGVPIT